MDTDLVDLVEHNESATASAHTVIARERLLKRGARDLEPLRRGWLMWSLLKWLAVCTLALITLAVFAAIPDAPAAALITGATSLVVVWIISSLARSCERRLQSGFDRWRAEIFTHLESAANFSADSYLASGDFEASGLNKTYYNRYSGDGHIALPGLRASNLALNHVYTETYYVTDANGNRVARTRTVVDPVFHGVMLIVDAELPCRGTVVINDPGHGIAGLRKVQVASTHLKKAYAIGADDPFTGHRVLTPSLQEALWKYRSDFKHLPRFAYRSDLLYVAIPGANLNAGKRPNRWMPVTILRLERVLRDCDELIGFLRGSAEQLRPELDD